MPSGSADAEESKSQSPSTQVEVNAATGAALTAAGDAW